MLRQVNRTFIGEPNLRYTVLSSSATIFLLINRRAVAIRSAEVLWAVALVMTAFRIPVFAKMQLAWRFTAVFMAIKDSNRFSDNVSV